MITHEKLEYVWEKLISHFKGNPSDKSIKTFKETLSEIYRSLMRGTRRNALDFLYRSASIRSLFLHCKLQLHNVQPGPDSPQPHPASLPHTLTHSATGNTHTHSSAGSNRSSGSAVLNRGKRVKKEFTVLILSKRSRTQVIWDTLLHSLKSC